MKRPAVLRRGDDLRGVFVAFKGRRKRGVPAFEGEVLAEGKPRIAVPHKNSGQAWVVFKNDAHHVEGFAFEPIGALVKFAKRGKFGLVALSHIVAIRAYCFFVCEKKW